MKDKKEWSWKNAWQLAETLMNTKLWKLLEQIHLESGALSLFSCKAAGPAHPSTTGRLTSEWPLIFILIYISLGWAGVGAAKKSVSDEPCKTIPPPPSLIQYLPGLLRRGSWLLRKHRDLKMQNRGRARVRYLFTLGYILKILYLRFSWRFSLCRRRAL